MKSLITVIFLFTITSMLVYPFFYMASEKERTITVESKERVITTEGKDIKSKYMVFTDNGVYQVTDSFLYLEWDSSDRYNALKIGKQFKIKTIGWRSGFLSMYPNIVKVGAK